MNDVYLWVWLLFWTFVIVFGGFLTTDHWHDWKWCSRLPHGLLTVLGLVLVGFGTLLTTWFWNELTLAEQRRSMIKAMGEELVQLHTVAEYIMDDGKNPEIVSGVRFYPRLPIATLEAGLASGVFVDEGHLLATLRNTISVLSQMNSRLDHFEQSMGVANEAQIAELRSQIESNEKIRETVFGSIKDLATILKDEYGLDGEYSPYKYKPLKQKVPEKSGTGSRRS